MKDTPVPAFVKVTLNVPRGLWELLDKMQCMTNEAPKQYLESIMTKELECILGNLDSTFFDLKHIRTKYGEGSEVSNWE